MTKRFNFSASAWRSSALATAAALILAGVAAAQPSTSASSAKPTSEGGYSLIDLTVFGGYQWFQFGQGTSAAIHQFKGSAVWGERLSEELSNYIAVEEGIQIGYNSFEFAPLGATSLSRASSGNTSIYAAGVVNLAPRTAKFRPFLLIGPEYVWYKPPNFGSDVIAPGTPSPILYPPSTHETGRTALTYGIGVKINQSPRFAWRIDVRGMRSGTPTFGIPTIATAPGTVYIQGTGSHESSITATVGLTFRFRYVAPVVAAPPLPPPPPPPVIPAVTVSVSGGPASVCAGDNVRLTATAGGGAPNGTPSYQWLINGSPAPGGTASSFNVPTADTPGTKSVTVTVTIAGASATSAPFSVTVQPLTPPTISFGISPSTVPYGTRITLAATGNGSTCGGPVTIRYSGQGVSGNTFDSTSLGFDQSNRLKQQSQTVTITATATDQKNQNATATAPVTVTLTAQARRLEDIVFPLNSARVNNCAKRILLEELTPMLRADPDAKVVLIGHKDTAERSKTLDELRVENTAAVLSAGKGICPSLDLSRVEVNWVGTDQTDETRPALCGTSTNVKEKGGQGVKESDKRAQYRRVEIWIIPGGADTPANLSGFKTTPVKEIQAKGCPK